MLFNTVEFWLFFVAVVAVYYGMAPRFRPMWLLGASCAFYMRWNASYIVLIGLSAVVDYTCGRLLGRTDLSDGQRKAVLVTSLLTNLGLLFTFKYWGWFHDTVGAVADLVGVAYAEPELQLLLPVGISFYTFQTMSYSVDLYKRKLAKPETNFIYFALYVVFFPQLVAGPIERAGHLLDQFRKIQVFDADRVLSGLQLAGWGLFKKVVVADRLAVYVDAVFGNVEVHNATTFLLATYAFAIQIYCDFSGYSDIAIGTARVLGIDLMRNFERPYFSTSITEFWRRWHISLSSWLRDYLYIPLGGNRHGSGNTYRNLMITMLLGGLWHGASWNYVIWGGLQGGMLSASRVTLATRDAWSDRVGIPRWLRNGVRMVTCFHLVCFSWIFFRARTFDDAAHVVSALARLQFGVPFVDIVTFAHAAVGVAVLVAFEIYEERRGDPLQRLARMPTVVRWTAWYALLGIVVLFGVQSASQFIYFQF